MPLDPSTPGSGPAPASPAASSPPPSSSPPASSGSGSPPPSSSPAPVSTPSPSSPGSVATGSASASTPAPEQSGVLDALRQIGLQDFAGQYQDDHAALQALAVAYRQLQQAQPLLPYAQQFAQHAAPFQQWLQQQQAAARQPAKPANPFGLPEFDQRLLQLVRRDDQGNLQALPGAPPDAVQRVTDYAYKLREAQDQFWQDPQKFLGPMIQEAIRRDGGQLVQQGLGGYQEQLAANTFVQQNSDWLHAKDQSGNLIRDPMSRQPILSQWGQRFAQYVSQAEQYGVRGVNAQRDFALGMVQRDALAQQHQAANAQAGAQTANDAAKQQFLQQAAGGVHSPNAGGSVQPPSPNGTAPSQQPSMNLRERLSKRFKENGFQVPQTVG